MLPQHNDLKSQIQKENADYLNEIKKQVNELNRRNIQNIINFIKEEAGLWQGRYDSG